MIFVDREEELSALEKLLDSVKKGKREIVLIYGLRRVGKTILIQKFLENKNGIFVDCSDFVNGHDFFKGVYLAVSELLGYSYPFEPSELESDILKRYYPLFEGYFREDLDGVKMAFNLVSEVAKEFDYIVVALDEVHGFIENYAKFSSNQSYEISREKILWSIRSSIQNSPNNIMWIFLTSAGFLFEEYGRADRAFLELFKKIEVKPLNRENSKKLAKKLLDLYNVKHEEETIEKIAELSGGIPALIEKITFLTLLEKTRKAEDIAKKVKESLIRGEFDEYFYSHINFIAETTRWSRQTLIKILRTIAEGNTKTKEISKQTNIKQTTLANILNDLRKKQVLDKQNNITYPLLKEWLLSKNLPPHGKPRIDLLHYNLGITLESYIREIFSKINKKIKLKDSDELFYGTTKELEIEPVKKVEGGGEIDLIAHTENKLIIAEIKSGTISERDVKKEKITKIIIAKTGAQPSAIAEAARRNIIILSKKAIKKLAKQTGMPPII